MPVGPVQSERVSGLSAVRTQVNALVYLCSADREWVRSVSIYVQCRPEKSRWDDASAQRSAATIRQQNLADAVAAVANAKVLAAARYRLAKLSDAMLQPL